MPTPASALVLFDIDGTLLRRAGPHHREALIEAVRHVTGIETSLENVPVAGMLDRDICREMLRQAGAKASIAQRHMPEIVLRAQHIYVRSCPNLRTRVCPGVRSLLYRLHRRQIPTGLVTGNLTGIGWKKMEQAGLKQYLWFGSFAETAKDRAGLARRAIQQARKQGWIGRESKISLIGDHPNDIHAAKANGIQSIAVGTGVVGMEQLLQHSPDVLVPDLRSLPLNVLI